MSRKRRWTGNRRGSITLAAVSVCVLAAGLSCPARQGGPSSAAAGSGDESAVFLTGSELGSLRPCGCSGGQLGGIEKRSAIFNSVPASRRLVVETGSLVPSEREQDLMKFRIFFEALRLLQYDAVHLTGSDYETANHLGLLADAQPFQVLQAGEKGQSVMYAKRITVGGRDITVNVISFNSPAAVLWPPPFVMDPPAGPMLNIMILDYDPGPLVEGVPKEFLMRSWAPRGAECVICPSQSDEPQLLSKPGKGPLVCTVGRFGRYVCRLGITVEAGTGRLVVGFESVPVQAKLPDDPALVRLYRQYQQLVAQSSLLESYPRVPPADKLAFAGSASCRSCHVPQYEKWTTVGHAYALASLQKVGSDRDPECVVCHVVGLESEGGFVTERETPALAGVGCESCHGPGSAHVLDPKQKTVGQPRTTCAKCHTPERSAGFAGHEEEYMKKIIHWREPAAVGNVK